MTSEMFTYWLQGFVELQESDVISEKQWLVIKDHLKLVFDKKTPNYEIKPNIETKPGILGGWEYFNTKNSWPTQVQVTC